MKLRLWLRQHRGIPVAAGPAAQAEDWLSGEGDLLIAGMGGQVRVAVRLGVLAHASLNRLAGRPAQPTWLGMPSMGNRDGPPRR